ncbi:hypothetical protein GCM10023087_20990 [Microbacterium rhizosphaerae]
MWGSTCHAINDGSTVSVGASREGAHQNTPTKTTTNKPRPTPSPSAIPIDCVTDTIACRDTYSVIVLPTPHAEDLAAFTPRRPTLTVEPDGVGIVGAPTNLVAAVPTHALTGTLFDYPVAVRFTPAAYEYDYGDGSRSTTSTGGASWDSLRQAQLTSTPTSHVYRERGSYAVTVRVVYDAAVDWGSGRWVAVIGQVRSAPMTTGIQVYEAHTALVAHTCAEAPTAPGC